MGVEAFLWLDMNLQYNRLGGAEVKQDSLKSMRQVRKT